MEAGNRLDRNAHARVSRHYRARWYLGCVSRRTIVNVMPEDVAATEFDLAAWRKELLALNQWAREFTINDSNKDFAAARQKATLARHAEGNEAWNGWAKGMLALKVTLEDAGLWGVRRSSCGVALAFAVFSTWGLYPLFDPCFPCHNQL